MIYFLLQGQVSQMPAVDVSYMTYSRWQKQLLQTDMIKSQLQYWEKELAGVEPLLLPSDRPRPVSQVNIYLENIDVI